MYVSPSPPKSKTLRKIFEATSTKLLVTVSVEKSLSQLVSFSYFFSGWLTIGKHFMRVFPIQLQVEKMMRGVIGRRLRSTNSVTRLIGSVVNWRPQLSYSSNNSEWSKEDEDAEWKEMEAIRERLSMYPSIFPFGPGYRCTREEKAELFSIAKSLPENVPVLFKEYALYRAYELQRDTMLGFEEKSYILQDKVDEISQTFNL